jgi:predicted ArsR family transcriptional regulator
VGASPALLDRRRSSWIDGVADPVRLQILRSLSRVAEATTSELAAHSQASYQTLRRHLEALEALGVIEARPGRSHSGRSGRPAARFRLAPAVRESVCAVIGAAP